MGEIADDGSISFLRQDSRRRGCYNTVSCVPFQNKQTFVFTNHLCGGMDWKKNFPLQRKMYKKLHVQITWPTAYHNIFTHLKDLTSREERVKWVWRAARRGLHGWLLSYADLRGTSTPELFVYHEENIWATKYLILSHFGARSFCHLGLGKSLKVVFPNIRFFYCSLKLSPAQNWRISPFQKQE